MNRANSKAGRGWFASRIATPAKVRFGTAWHGERLESRRCMTTLNFVAEPLPAGELSFESGQVVAAGDIDGDGDLDLVMTDSERVGWVENLGTGEFAFGHGNLVAERELWPGPTQPQQRVEVGDIDGDQDLDLLVHGDGIRWYENTDGRGSFSARIPIRRVPSIRDAALADLDGDGDLDVAAMFHNWRYWQGATVWYENIDRLGAGTFGPNLGVDGLSVRPDASLHVADLNGDGRLDLLVNSSNDGPCGYLGWYENQGDVLRPFSSFQMGVPSPTDPRRSICSTVKPSIVDLDGDGHLDIVGLSRDQIWWMRNTDGQGTFEHATVPAKASRHLLELAVVDLDGDGILDLLDLTKAPRAGHFVRTGQLGWQRGLGGPNEFAKREAIVDDVTLSLVVDIDGDGDLDIFAHDGQQSVLLRAEPNRPDPVDNPPGDLNDDGVVDGADVQQLIAGYGATVERGTAADLNRDGRVDFADFLLLRSEAVSGSAVSLSAASR